MKSLIAPLITGAILTLGASLLAPSAHADYVGCDVSPGGALWCENYDTGDSWQASDYGTYFHEPAYCVGSNSDAPGC
jgi:hypothetical protein